MFSIEPSTRQWIAQTLAGYLFLVLWVLSILNPPLVVLAPAVQTIIFGLGVGALGLQTVSSYRSVRAARASK